MAKLNVKSNDVVSHSKEQFASLIEVYKKQNPEKYELKKAALEKKLASL